KLVENLHAEMARRLVEFAAAISAVSRAKPGAQGAGRPWTNAPFADKARAMSATPTIDGQRVYEKISPQALLGGNGWDAIIVGSGSGGMSCAAALAHYGRKVLLLEQHYVPGGFTHSFARKGFTWDAGVHAIGEMGPGEVPGKMLRWLTGDRVEMVPLGDPYDR